MDSVTNPGWFDFGEPHLSRGPFSRWPHAADGVLAVAVFVASLIAVGVSALADGEELGLATVGDLPVPAITLLALTSVALLWRRRWPIVVTSSILAGMTGWALAGYGDGHDLPLVVAIYSVGRYTTAQRHSLSIVAAAIGISIIGTVIDTHQRIDIAPAILLVVLPWYVGRRVRNRGDYLALLRERAERLEAEQHARAHRAVADERARIARELHDVVAHRVSMMTVQAGAAKTIARDDLDSAIEAMGDVERAGRQALGELRHLLGVLRPDSADPGDLGPQPGLADIAALADELARTGTDITRTIADLPSDIPIAVDLSSYRIVQESLTNIIKHAGPNPAVDMTVGIDGGILVIDIVNTTGPTSPDLPESGYGIMGMRERANLLGGSLVAEMQPPDRFHVRARLPLDRETR